MRLNLQIDGKLRLTADFRPERRSRPESATGGGEFEATFAEARDGGAATRLERGEEGSVAIANGSEAALDITRGGARFAIPGGIAELINHDDGVTLATDGDVPIALRQDADGVVLVVGDRISTPVRDRLDRSAVGARAARRPRNGADGARRTIPAVDHFGHLADVREAEAKARRIQSVINRGLLSRERP